MRRTLSGHVTNVINNCGLPVSGTNQAYSSTGSIGPQDCDVTISLDDPAAPVDDYRATLRKTLPKLFPGTTFTFLPGDITAKILNFGLPAPIDIQISGRNLANGMTYAQSLIPELNKIPGIADVTIQQSLAQPTLMITAHRAFALGAGLTESDIANNTLSTLSGSGQTAPTFWLNRDTGVSYLVNLQTPQTQNDVDERPRSHSHRQGRRRSERQRRAAARRLEHHIPARPPARGVAP